MQYELDNFMVIILATKNLRAGWLTDPPPSGIIAALVRCRAAPRREHPIAAASHPIRANHHSAKRRLARQAPQEAILDPQLPIIDTHNHFWNRPDHRYLLDELRADLATGHNIVATVFLECRSM